MKAWAAALWPLLVGLLFYCLGYRDAAARYQPLLIDTEQTLHDTAECKAAELEAKQLKQQMLEIRGDE